MTLDEIRAEKIKMEEAIFFAVREAQKAFEDKTKLMVNEINFGFVHHSYVGGKEVTRLSSVRTVVDPW